MLLVPQEEKVKTIEMLSTARDSKKLTVHYIQQLTGTLNFLNQAIVPGRAFTRGMYRKLSAKMHGQTKKLKPHHHIAIDKEFKADCKLWQAFLKVDNTCLSRPFIDFTDESCEVINFTSAASLNESLGMGAVYQNSWMVVQWPLHFIKQEKPSIEFLELFALTAAVVTWCQKDTSLHNRRIKIFCDNESVMYMVNTSASTCSQCRKLIRILTLCNIRYNNRIIVRHIRSKDNLLLDALSRLDFDRF